jgi:hypothetical protein
MFCFIYYGTNHYVGKVYFMNISCVVITEKYNVMVNSEELIGTTEYLTL